MSDVAVMMPSGKVERCSKPGRCRRHDPGARVEFANQRALEDFFGAEVSKFMAPMSAARPQAPRPAPSPRPATAPHPHSAPRPGGAPRPQPQPAPKQHYLSARKVQPGHVQKFHESESRFTNEVVQEVQALFAGLGGNLRVETSGGSKTKSTKTHDIYLDGKLLLQVQEHPRDLKDIIKEEKSNGRSQGIEPELKIFNPANGKVMFYEVKEQGENGNAHERAMKLFAPRFQKVMREKCGTDYHPYRVVAYKNLSTDERYLNEFEFYLEPEQYILGENKADLRTKVQADLRTIGIQF